MPETAVPPVTLTVTVVAAGSGEPFSEAVTVTAVAAAVLSPTAVGFSDSITAVGAVSSSVIVSVAAPASSPATLPVRITVSLPSYRPSPVGSNDSVAVPLVCPSWIVTVKSLTAA